jgi:hypothetical protein
MSSCIAYFDTVQETGRPRYLPGEDKGMEKEKIVIKESFEYENSSIVTYINFCSKENNSEFPKYLKSLDPNKDKLICKKLSEVIRFIETFVSSDSIHFEFIFKNIMTSNSEPLRLCVYSSSRRSRDYGTCWILDPKLRNIFYTTIEQS